LRYGLLLIILIVTYLLSASYSSYWIGVAQLVLFTATGLLALRNSPLGRHLGRLIVAGSLIGSAIMVVFTVLLLHRSPVGLGIASLWTGLLLMMTVVLIVLQILALPVVTLQSICGALSAYLIIGLMFASFYAAMWHLSGTAFFAPGELRHAQMPNTTIFQYFSFTTLTTLGYGDFTAATNAGRAVAVLEAVAGQIFLATLVARLVAAFRTPAEHPAG
jgi:Ion channel